MRRPFTPVLLLALATLPLAAQTPTIRARTSLVMVPVTVLDHHGDAVDGLGPSDFTLLSDGAPQRFHLDTTDTIDAPGATRTEDLPLSTGHERMQQGGEPLAFLYIVRLARRATARSRDGGLADRRDHDGERTYSGLRGGSQRVGCWAQDHE